MVQSRTRKWVFMLVWVAMIGVATDLGLRRVKGALPTCEVCQCKILTYWFTGQVGGSNLGWRTVGGANTQISAWPSVQTVKGTCDSPKWQPNGGTGDIYNWDNGFYICGPANLVLSEISIGGNSRVSTPNRPTATCVQNP